MPGRSSRQVSIALTPVDHRQDDRDPLAVVEARAHRRRPGPSLRAPGPIHPEDAAVRQCGARWRRGLSSAPRHAGAEDARSVVARVVSRAPGDRPMVRTSPAGGGPQAMQPTALASCARAARLQPWAMGELRARMRAQVGRTASVRVRCLWSNKYNGPSPAPPMLSA